MKGFVGVVYVMLRVATASPGWGKLSCDEEVKYFALKKVPGILMLPYLRYCQASGLEAVEMPGEISGLFEARRSRRRRSS